MLQQGEKLHGQFHVSPFGHTGKLSNPHIPALPEELDELEDEELEVVEVVQTIF